MTTTISFDTSHMQPVGTRFFRRGKVKKEYEVIGYHVAFDTDTDTIKVWYRVQSFLMGQAIKETVPPTTVAMGMIEAERRASS